LHIIIRNGFADAHQVSTPFDANVKLNAVGDNDEIEEDFTYQHANRSLMFAMMV